MDKDHNQLQKGIIGEEIVNNLCFSSYLKYWCYPNPVHLNGNKKEICDLLILFFDTAIIISVKNYNLKGNYERYKRKVIQKSSKQIFGAERKLFSSNKILINHPTKGSEIFQPEKYKNIFRITVSTGEAFDNYEFVDNKEGKGCINIFNKNTFEIIVQELDTIKDLVEYLKKRELFLVTNKYTSNDHLEKDLLAVYLLNNREFPTKSVMDTEFSNRKWEEYNNNKAVFFKRLEDQKSFFIDKLVRDDVLKLKDGETLAKELMTTSRFERRLIANNLYEIVEQNEDKDDFLARRFTSYNNIGFLFIYYPIERPQEEIDFVLKKAQELYAYFHDSKKIVLLAASKGLKQWKFSLFEAFELNKKKEEYLINLAKEFGWFQNEKKIIKRTKEYPEK